MDKMKQYKIIALILIALILATYYPLITSRIDNDPFYSYKDLITGQQWEISKVNNKRIEYPINVFDRLSGERLQQYNEMKNELDRLNKIVSDNQEAHDNYNDSSYTGGLTFDDLGINGGSTLSDSDVTAILHEGAQKRLEKQQEQYIDAANKVDDLNIQINDLKNQLIDEAWKLRNAINNVRIFLIIWFLFFILYKKLWRISKKAFSFIIND